MGLDRSYQTHGRAFFNARFDQPCTFKAKKMVFWPGPCISFTHRQFARARRKTHGFPEGPGLHQVLQVFYIWEETLDHQENHLPAVLFNHHSSLFIPTSSIGAPAIPTRLLHSIFSIKARSTIGKEHGRDFGEEPLKKKIVSLEDWQPYNTGSSRYPSTDPDWQPRDPGANYGETSLWWRISLFFCIILCFVEWDRKSVV